MLFREPAVSYRYNEHEGALSERRAIASRDPRGGGAGAISCLGTLYHGKLPAAASGSLVNGVLRTHDGVVNVRPNSVI